ncbi:MAG: hypothetical protein K8L97_32260 [Anaerolineae bacterium]|nr:hypothetical protein [Anaerolineae bacterium]
MRKRWMGLATGVLMAGIVLAIGLLSRPELAPSVDVPCEPVPGDLLPLVRELVHDYRDPCAEFYWMPEPTDEFHNLIKLNNFGLHAPDYQLEKPSGVFRILIVGDSFPQGMQVKWEAAFPNLLNALAPQKSVEVINLSVDAYGTDRELLLYALLGWQFQPDVVILALYPGNDIQDNQIDLEQRRYGYRLNRPFFTLDDGLLRLHNSPVFDPSLYPDAPVYQWLMELQADESPAPPENPPLRPAVVSQPPNYQIEYPVEIGLYLPEDAHWAEAWALTEALILQFRAVVALQNIPFGAIIIPDRRAVHNEDWAVTAADYAAVLPELADADPRAASTRLETFLAEKGIPALNLTDNLRSWIQANPGERLYYPIDGHFNAQGHTVVAEAIAPWLADLGN